MEEKGFDPLEQARRYLQTIERGATGEDLALFFAPDVVQEEFPNRLSPAGVRRNLADILASAERGQKVIKQQRYEVVNAVAADNRVALEVRWSATIAVPVGSLPPGGQMRAHFAVFLEFREGKIVTQRNYDCLDSF